MNIQDMHTIYDYNYWANQRILETAKKVKEDQFLAPASLPYGGLRGTLVHILDAEFGWRSFLQSGDWSVPDLKEADFPTLAAIEARWRTEKEGMLAYLATLTDADLGAHKIYTTAEGKRRDRILWHCLWHVVNHGTQHRSEAAALLTDYGCSPGNLDFTVFQN